MAQEQHCQQQGTSPLPLLLHLYLLHLLDQLVWILGWLQIGFIRLAQKRNLGTYDLQQLDHKKVVL